MYQKTIYILKTHSLYSIVCLQGTYKVHAVSGYATNIAAVVGCAYDIVVVSL